MCWNLSINWYWEVCADWVCLAEGQWRERIRRQIIISVPLDHTSPPSQLHSPDVSVAYTAEEVKYSWLSGTDPVGLEKGLQMSQFDLQETFSRELNFTRSESVGAFSVLQVVFLLQRHTGYFLIQVGLVLVAQLTNRVPGLPALCADRGPLLGGLLAEQRGHLGQSDAR